MTIRRYTQTSFTQGEVGSFIKGRAELGIYRAGLETCENFLLLPQGGLDRRRGFKFISSNLDSSTLADGSTSITTGSFHSQRRYLSPPVHSAVDRSPPGPLPASPWISLRSR